MRVKIVLVLLFLSLMPLFALEKMTFVTVQNSVIVNITQQVMKEAYKQLGIEIKVEYFPAKRALFLANAGKLYDGELHRIHGIEKRFPNLIPVPVPINYLEGVALSYKKDFKINGWESLRPYSIAVRRGIAFTNRGTKGMNRVVLNTNEHLMQMLNAKRIDMVVMSRINALKQLQNEKKSEIIILEPPVEVFEMYHYVHKKNIHLVPKLTSILKQMQKEGKIQKIRDDYIDNNFKK